MRALLVCALAMCVLGAGVSGCKPKQSKAERQALQMEALRQDVEAQFAEILALQSMGQMDDAMALLEKCFADKKYAIYRTRFFTQKIDLLLVQDKCEEAGKLILTTWAKDAQLAQSVFGRVRAYYQDKRDNEAMLAWCKQLLGMGETFPKHLRSQVLEWQLSAATTLDDIAAITDAVGQMVAELSPDKAMPLLQQAINSMIGAAKFDQVSAVIGCLASHQEYRDVVVTTNLKSLVAQKDWEKVSGAFEACAAQLKDDVLSTLLRQTFATLQKSGQIALLEKTCHGIFMAAPTKKVSASYAARIWVDIGMMANKNVLQERLVALLDAKIQAEQVAMLFERYFYEFVEDHAAIKNLCVLGERIMSECSDQETKDSLKVKVLDGAFIREDYDLVLQMLERGIPDKPKEWHDMSIPKVKAHRALAQNKTQEAIEYFREFTKVMAASGPEEEHDPTTGVAYSKEWILARNAHRIATLYDTLSDAANAAKAREEAKAHFAAARVKAEKDTDTLKVLVQEMQEMGFSQ